MPENTLHFAVGVIIMPFGIFGSGEGMSIAWSGPDLALIAIARLLFGAGLSGVRLATAPARTQGTR